MGRGGVLDNHIQEDHYVIDQDDQPLGLRENVTVAIWGTRV